MATNRTDIHRKGAIVPANYEYVLSYNLPTTFDGWPVPSFKVNCAQDYADRDDHGNIITLGQHSPDGNCCLVGLRTIANVKWAEHGTTGKCTVCGTSFVYGEVWKHVVTGEHIHVGHICASKYGLLRSDSEFELEYGRHVQATAVYLQRRRNEEERAAFLATRPGLAEALKVSHPIIEDIRGRFIQRKYLSDKQVAFVLKLADEVLHPKAKEEETKVRTPEGRQTFEGTIVSAKWQDTQFGTTLKLTVKVATPEGIWLAWGTRPSSIHVDGGEYRGRKVRITGTLTRSDRDEHFAFFKRPVGELLDSASQ